MEGLLTMWGHGRGNEAFKDGLVFGRGVKALDVRRDNGWGLPRGLRDTAGELGYGGGLGGSKGSLQHWTWSQLKRHSS